MTKTMIETITEAIRDPKHSFRKADSQPRKAMKHRYERRKIKEYLHLAEWIRNRQPEPDKFQPRRAARRGFFIGTRDKRRKIPADASPP
jgi:hypothetical protein